MKKLQRSLQIKILLSCFLPIIFFGENLTLKEIFDSYTKFFFLFRFPERRVIENQTNWS